MFIFSYSSFLSSGLSKDVTRHYFLVSGLVVDVVVKMLENVKLLSQLSPISFLKSTVSFKVSITDASTHACAIWSRLI